ncbi:Protein-tyrosine-phosphatase PTP1 [Bienertia sinuspersici]
MQTPAESAAQFIATQGPLPHTYEDFWEMVLQYRYPAIVMLTRLVDDYRVKCDNYFEAENGPREFGDIFVVTKWMKTTESSLVLRHLEVTRAEVNSLVLNIICSMEW